MISLFFRLLISEMVEAGPFQSFSFSYNYNGWWFVTHWETSNTSFVFLVSAERDRSLILIALFLGTTRLIDGHWNVSYAFSQPVHS